MYASVAELYDKIDWEGGFPDVIFGYGIYSKDLPEDTPADIIEIWKRLEDMDEDIRKVQGWLEDHADDDRDYNSW